MGLETGVAHVLSANAAFCAESTPPVNGHAKLGMLARKHILGVRRTASGVLSVNNQLQTDSNEELCRKQIIGEPTKRCGVVGRRRWCRA